MTRIPYLCLLAVCMPVLPIQWSQIWAQRRPRLKSALGRPLDARGIDLRSYLPPRTHALVRKCRTRWLLTRSCGNGSTLQDSFPENRFLRNQKPLLLKMKNRHRKVCSVSIFSSYFHVGHLNKIFLLHHSAFKPSWCTVEEPLLVLIRLADNRFDCCIQSSIAWHEFDSA